jgi:hypothetical protein
LQLNIRCEVCGTACEAAYGAYEYDPAEHDIDQEFLSRDYFDDIYDE